MKKLLVIGASVLQLPAILKAKEMGLQVAVADYNPKALGIQYADEFFNASTIDEDAICGVAEEYRPDGIMTLATDMPMRSVAKACSLLGLPGISYETAVKATDKSEMIKAFMNGGVSCPWHFTVHSPEELESVEKYISYPCIIKPTDNAGSRGVVLLRSAENLFGAYEYSRAESRKGNVIIEEFLEGEEVSVEVMVQDGVVHVLQITDKITTGAPHFVEMGHTQPSHHSPEICSAIRETAEAAVKAVGIDCGPAHVEMMVTSRGPVMIELGARMGGDCITTHLVPLSTGIDMVKATIEISLGLKPDLTPKFSHGSAIRYLSAPEGEIKNISGVEAAKAVDGVAEVILTKAAGERSSKIKSSNDRIGSVISSGNSRDEAILSCERALECIKVEIE